MSGRFRIGAASCPSTQSFPDIASHDANIVIPVVIGHRRYFTSTPLLGSYRPAVGRAQPLLISVPHPADLHGGLTWESPTTRQGLGRSRKRVVHSTTTVPVWPSWFSPNVPGRSKGALWSPFPSMRDQWGRIPPRSV